MFAPQSAAVVLARVQSVVGSELARLRSAAGLELAQVAEGTGYQVALLQEMESGRISPTITQLYVLCGVYGRDPVEFLAATWEKAS